MTLRPCVISDRECPRGGRGNHPEAVGPKSADLRYVPSRPVHEGIGESTSREVLSAIARLVVPRPAGESEPNRRWPGPCGESVVWAPPADAETSRPTSDRPCHEGERTGFRWGASLGGPAPGGQVRQPVLAGMSVGVPRGGESRDVPN